MESFQHFLIMNRILNYNQNLKNKVFQAWMQYTFDDNKRFIDETKRNIWNNHVDLLECCEYGFSNKLLQRLLFIYGVNCKDSNDDIPLLWACRDGRTMTAKRLIEFGADINHGQNSSRPSSILIKMLTTSRGTRFKTVLLLIRSGIDINFTNSVGENALYKAFTRHILNKYNNSSWLGDQYCRLIKRGQYIRPRKGWGTFDLFSGNDNNIPIINLLIANGANCDKLMEDIHNPSKYEFNPYILGIKGEEQRLKDISVLRKFGKLRRRTMKNINNMKKINKLGKQIRKCKKKKRVQLIKKLKKIKEKKTDKKKIYKKMWSLRGKFESTHWPTGLHFEGYKYSKPLEKIISYLYKTKKFNDIFINTMFGIYASSDREVLKIIALLSIRFPLIGSSIGGCDDIWYGIIMPLVCKSMI